MEFENTHPWINFSQEVKSDDPLLWLKLGEVASKCEHLSGVALTPEFAKELLTIFLAKGVMATTAIEGNTLTEDQVRKQVRGELNLPPSQKYLQQEIKNIIDLCNEEFNRRKAIDGDLSPNKMKSYNQQILSDLELEKEVIPGEFRMHSVLVGNVYRGAPAKEVPYLIDRLCEWLNSDSFKATDPDLEIPYALIKAIFAHIYIAWIHPFGDGNGRTARIVEFHILYAAGVPLPASHLLSDHYNKTRAQYYRELDKSSKSGGELMPFIRYAAQGMLDGIRDQISGVREHQMEIAWRHFVHEKFRVNEKKASKAQKRQRDLVLEISNKDWVKKSEIEDLSVELRRAYAEAGDRMLQRDLNAIQELGLIIRRAGKVRVTKEIMQSFLPAKAPDSQQRNAPTT